MDTHLPERKLKLIWDFRGPAAEQTAKHHAHHLKEFGERESLKLQISGHKKLTDNHSIAYLVVYESEMPEVRTALRPNRGQYYEEQQ